MLLKFRLTTWKAKAIVERVTTENAPNMAYKLISYEKEHFRETPSYTPPLAQTGQLYGRQQGKAGITALGENPTFHVRLSAANQLLQFADSRTGTPKKHEAPPSK